MAIPRVEETYYCIDTYYPTTITSDPEVFQVTMANEERALRAAEGAVRSGVSIERIMVRKCTEQVIFDWKKGTKNEPTREEATQGNAPAQQGDL